MASMKELPAGYRKATKEDKKKTKSSAVIYHFLGNYDHVAYCPCEGDTQESCGKWESGTDYYVPIAQYGDGKPVGANLIKLPNGDYISKNHVVGITTQLIYDNSYQDSPTRTITLVQLTDGHTATQEGDCRDQLAEQINKG